MAPTVEKVKKLIFPGQEPEQGQMDLLEEIDDLVRQRLLGLLGGLIEKPPDTVPEELEYIVVEVDIKRFNRIGSEGLTSETMGSHSASYDDKGDFEEYLEEISGWALKQEEDKRNSLKVVRFL